MKRALVFILSALIILTVFAVSSCDKEPSSTLSGSSSGQTHGSETAPKDDWPDVTFENGSVLNILGRKVAPGDWYAETLTDEAVNDAVYERNEWLKEKHNFSITLTIAENDDAWLETARAASQSGGEKYDLFVGCGKNMSTIAQENLLLDMAKLENIDLDAEWWDDNATHDLSIANRVFMTSGAIQTSDIRSVYCVFMNKTALDEIADHPDPYQLVREGKWTLTNMFEIVKDCYVDVNGNGKCDFEDKYGYTCENYDGYAMYFCSGERVVKKDEDDLPQLSVYSTRTVEYLEVLKNFYKDKSVLVDYSKNIRPISMENRSVFCGSLLSAISTYRAMPGDFGILPMPMYEENQGSFSHTVSVCTTGSLVGIPACTEDPDKTSMMVELLARKSLTTLRPAYLETTVMSRGLRDEDSLEMLNIIVGSRVYDVAYMNCWGPKTSPGGTYGWMLYFYYVSGSPDVADKFVSTYEISKDLTVEEINATVEAYRSHF